MEPLEVDIDALRQGAAGLDQARESIRQVFERFQAMVANFENAFGDDEIGTLLSVGHEACMNALTECLSTNFEELGSYADGLRQMADSYQAAEEEISASFRSILGTLGG